MAEVLRVPTPAGGWGRPWPDVAELAAAVPHEAWTLIGGLMIRLHAVAAGLPVVRPTNDVDVLLHVETGRGRAQQVATALEGLGYRLRPSIDPARGRRTGSSSTAPPSTWWRPGLIAPSSTWSPPTTPRRGGWSGSAATTSSR
ncbi:hypothetical protein ACI8AC_06165 [Geodermatophilus sp. SYSU D00758]